MGVSRRIDHRPLRTGETGGKGRRVFSPQKKKGGTVSIFGREVPRKQKQRRIDEPIGRRGNNYHKGPFPYGRFSYTIRTSKSKTYQV